MCFKSRPPDLITPSTRVQGSRWTAATTSTNNPMTPGEVTALYTRAFGGFIMSVTRRLCVFFMRAESEGLDRSPPEPTKEKEKQGFFRSMKKKKKKSQAVSPCTVCVCVCVYVM